MSGTSNNGPSASGAGAKLIGSIIVLAIACYIFIGQGDPIKNLERLNPPGSEATHDPNEFMNSVASDSEKQYEMMQKSHYTAMEACTLSGTIASEYLSAHNQDKYEHWHDVQRSTCKAAGM